MHPAIAIPGSYWGESEAGLIGNRIYFRPDTPLHSVLHEACHFICMDDARRAQLERDAGGDYDEENAVCYLQILLADEFAGSDSQRMCSDMDAWGYTFRLGSARAWFERDADDARALAASSASDRSTRSRPGASDLPEPVGRADQLVRVAGLERRVAGVRHDAQIRFGPGAMQRPRRLHRAHHVVAALHDHGRDLANRARRCAAADPPTPGSRD